MDEERKLIMSEDVDATSVQSGSTDLPAADWPEPPPDGWIYWISWDTISTGDCQMRSAIVHIYPDGGIYFMAKTLSSSQGDVWLVTWMQFYDAAWNPVGDAVPQHDGQEMSLANTEYFLDFWDKIPGATPTAVKEIRHAKMGSHC